MDIADYLTNDGSERKFTHQMKAREQLRNLHKIVKKEDLSDYDRKIADAEIENLLDALMSYGTGIISYDNIPDKLVEAIPELKTAYNDGLLMWDGELPGPYVVFGNVLNPFLIEQLEIDGNEELLKRIFDFLEILSNERDIHIQEVVAYSVLERLSGNNEIYQKARKYMGKTTLKFSYEVEEFWEEYAIGCLLDKLGEENLSDNKTHEILKEVGIRRKRLQEAQDKLSNM